MAKQINDLQYAAIVLLSIPERGGLTFEEVANKVGVSRQTLATWRKDETFTKALKDEIVRATIDDLPEIFASLKGHIVQTGNAALFRTLLQAHDMLTEKLEVDSKGGQSADIDEMKAKIERFRKGENAN